MQAINERWVLPFRPLPNAGEIYAQAFTEWKESHSLPRAAERCPHPLDISVPTVDLPDAARVMRLHFLYLIGEALKVAPNRDQPDNRYVVALQLVETLIGATNRRTGSIEHAQHKKLK